MKFEQQHLKIFLIALGVVFLLSGIIYTGYLFFFENQPTEEEKSVTTSESLTLMSEEEIDEAVKEKGYSDKEVASMTDEQKDKVIMGIEYYYEDNKIRLYSDASNAREYTGYSEEKYMEFVQRMCNEEYSTIIGEIQTILETSNLTKGDNLKYAAIYSDAVKMTEYPSLNKAGKEAILTGHHDINGLVADTLYAYVRRREAVILDGASATPVFKGEYSIDSYVKITEEDDDEYSYYVGLWSDKNIRSVYRVDLNIPDAEDMYCIVLEADDGILRIAGYYGDTGNKFLTVSERREMGVDVAD